jgi:hypothetical protein
MSKKIDKFKVEELEQRFETGRWIDSYKIGGSYEGVSVYVVVPA